MEAALQDLLKMLHVDKGHYSESLYSAGPYWNYKSIRTNLELSRKGLENFRGYDCGVGSSFSDNIITNPWNEEVSRIKKLLYFICFKLPILNRIGSFFQLNSQLVIKQHKWALKLLSHIYSHDKNVLELMANYKHENSLSYGCVNYVTVNDEKIALSYLEALNRINYIKRYIDLDSIYSMFEIGGGFGANIHLMLQNFKNIKKIVYLDIAPNLVVGTEYLRTFYKDAVVDYLSLREQEEIAFSDNDELEILCIAPWQIEKLRVSVDYFYNSCSFVEMTVECVRNYVSYINKLLSENGRIALVTYGNFDENNTISPEALKSIFGCQFSETVHRNMLDVNSENFYFVN